VTRLVDSSEIDHAAVAAAVDGLRNRGATCRAFIRARETKVCLNAVNAGRDAWDAYSAAASRRAATRGRRMLPVLDIGRLGDRFWIAYDVGSATPLADRHPLPTAISLRVLSDVARALDRAAGEGVFASELPPESVFFSWQGVRLGDLGTAREGLAGAEYPLEGDPAYVPPEVLRGERASERSGVYLFGALLHYLLRGRSPQPERSSASENGQVNLPASLKAIVATMTAQDPESRPQSVGEAHEMAKRALRGEPPARARRTRVATAGAAKRATEADVRPLAAAARPIAMPREDTRRAEPRRAASKAASVQRASPGATTATRAAPRAAAPKRGAPGVAAAKPAPAKPASKSVRAKGGAPKASTRQWVGSQPLVRQRAGVLGCALILGAAAGLLLAGSPGSEPARAQTVTAGGLSVTLPAGRHRVGSGDQSLLVRAPGSRLRARIVSRPPGPPSAGRPVRLGALEAWRRAAGGVVRYSVPTNRGTLVVTCWMTSPGSSLPLRRCERTASTLKLSDARALPLATAAGHLRRLRATIATLRAERDAARARLSSAATPKDQGLVAQDLADGNERAAAILGRLSGGESIEAAARGAAHAYARLAASAETGSAERWEEASEQVRRSDAELAKAIAAAGWR
jgi:hypothetical protein